MTEILEIDFGRKKDKMSQNAAHELQSGLACRSQKRSRTQNHLTQVVAKDKPLSGTQTTSELAP